MTRHYYRLYTSFRWLSGSGNCIFTIQNRVGSGKKVVITGIEVNCLTAVRSVTPYDVVRVDQLYGGEDAYVSKYDSLSQLPSTVIVRKNCGVNVLQTFNRMSYIYGVTTSAIILPLFVPKLKKYNPSPIVLRENQGIAVLGSVDSSTAPAYSEITFKVDDSQFTAVSYSILGGRQISPIAILNTDATRTVTVNRIIVYEVGTLDTPFIQIVPLGTIAFQSTYDNIARYNTMNVTKYDTSSPDLSNIIEVYQDVPMIPKGLPQAYASEGGAATPKGYNYLHTRDFDGTRFMTFFPEYRTGGIGLKPDDWGFTLKRKNNVIKQNIVLYEGEGIAAVSSTETLSTFGGLAGWVFMDIGINLYVESTCEINIKVLDNKFTPLSDVKVAIIDASTGEVLHSGLTDENGIFYTTHDYNGDVNVFVRARKSSPPFKRFLPFESFGVITSKGLSMTIKLDEDIIAS